MSQSEEGMAIETVVLPEETNVPATSTCPCDCHSNAQNMTFHTKVRHCQKCCIKVSHPTRNYSQISLIWSSILICPSNLVPGWQSIPPQWPVHETSQH